MKKKNLTISRTTRFIHTFDIQLCMYLFFYFQSTAYVLLPTYQVSTLAAGDFMALQVVTFSNRKVKLGSKYLRFGWKCFQISIGLQSSQIDFCNYCSTTDGLTQLELLLVGRFVDIPQERTRIARMVNEEIFPLYQLPSKKFQTYATITFDLCTT